MHTASAMLEVPIVNRKIKRDKSGFENAMIAVVE
jgi:hypothetical protein